MRTFLTLFVFAATAVPASTQVLVERFDYADLIFPPEGWVEVRMNKSATEGWENTSLWPVSLNALGPDAAGHDDYVPAALNDSWLITPEIDLSGVAEPQLVFDESLGFAMNLANHPSSMGDGMSQVLASTDGVTWTAVWNETRTEDGLYRDVRVPLDFLAGESGALLAFRYYGTYAHTWVVDDVRVGESPRPEHPRLQLLGNCGGQLGARLTNMTPGGGFHLAWSQQSGTAVVPYGPCVGTVIPVADPAVFLTGFVPDYTDAVEFKLAVPDFACGWVKLIGFDDGSCNPTNVVPL